jgi:hypothetical protein
VERERLCRYNSLMTSSFTRTLKLKVRSECYGWLNAAAVEVNTVYNYANETSWRAATRFCGKTFQVFESERLVKWGQGCFAQDAVGDWWLCLPVECAVEPSVAPREAVGIDLGLKDVAVTSDAERQMPILAPLGLGSSSSTRDNRSI